MSSKNTFIIWLLERGELKCVNYLYWLKITCNFLYRINALIKFSLFFRFISMEYFSQIE